MLQMIIIGRPRPRRLKLGRGPELDYVIQISVKAADYIRSQLARY